MARVKRDEDDIIIGRRISSIRIQKGMSGNDLGKKVGVSCQQIQKYESGASKASLTMLKRIANSFGVSLYELIGEGETTYDTLAEHKKNDVILTIIRSIHKMSDRDIQVISATARALIKG